MPIVIPAASGSTSSAQSVPTQQVFDYLLDSQGAAIKGAQVVVTLAAGNATTITPQVELSSVVIRTTTDANGYWSVNLIPNANINPANTTYSVQPPGLDAYSISVPSTGGPFQSTSPSVLVNTPGTLAPATTGITGNLTVSGNESITGTLSVTGTTTLGSTTTGALTTGAESVSGDLTILSAFRLLMNAAASKLVPGSTSFSVRDHADANDNLLVTDAGSATVRNGFTVTAGAITATAGDLVATAGRLVLNAAAAKIKGGATSLSLRNNADSADNVLVTDAGIVTLRNALSIPPSAGGTVAATSYGSVRVKLDEKTPSGVATFTFSSIPQGFRTLVIEFVARGDTAAVDTTMYFQLNGVSTASYSYQQLFGRAAAVTYGNPTAATANPLLANIPSATFTGGQACYGRIEIPFYSSSTFLPQVCCTSGFLNASDANSIEVTRRGYYNTAGAVTSLLLGLTAGNFVAGSTFSMYGDP